MVLEFHLLDGISVGLTDRVVGRIRHPIPILRNNLLSGIGQTLNSFCISISFIVSNFK